MSSVAVAISPFPSIVLPLVVGPPNPFVNPCSTPTPVTSVYFLFIQICLFWTFHMNGILQDTGLLHLIFFSLFQHSRSVISLPKFEKVRVI